MDYGLICDCCARHKCLSWSVEWISASGEKIVRNCLETGILSEAYNRAFPLPKEDRPNSTISKDDKGEQKESASTSQDTSNVSSEAIPTTDLSKEQLAQSSTSDLIETSAEGSQGKKPELPISPHRDVYFYLHRPRTTTKKPVLSPLPPSATLGSVLRGRTVLEFPTIYALPDAAEKLLAENEDCQFILEEEYLRTADPAEVGDKSLEQEQERTGGEDDAASDLQNLDENQVMDVLKQDLFEPIPEGEAS